MMAKACIDISGGILQLNLTNNLFARNNLLAVIQQGDSQAEVTTPVSMVKSKVAKNLKAEQENLNSKKPGPATSENL